MPLPAVDEATLHAWRARAVELHGAFVRELVEGHDFCPWAHSARIAGRSHLRALWSAELEHFFATSLRAADAQKIEVWQLVVLDAPSRAMQWRAYVADLEQYLRRTHGALPWAFAAFHPQHPGRPESIGGTIGMLRRSPLPTIQLVRLEVLERVRTKAATQVNALPQQNQETLRAWLQNDDACARHAQWLKEGQDLLQEIDRFSPPTPRE